MKIELKNIKVYERMSEETTAFNANIYIDGKLVGYANNKGCGGPTDYGHLTGKKEIISKAEEYCKSLPHVDPGFGIGPMPVTLEDIIDNQVTEFLKNKDKKKQEKLMVTNLLFGNEFQYYKMSWKRGGKIPITIEQMLSDPKGITAIKVAIQDYKKKMPDGNVLNTNIPESIKSIL